MSKHLARGVMIAVSIALAVPPPPLFAQPKLPATAETPASEFNVAQLDAMLAPIALYPDELLTQLLMATTYPLQIVAAARWLEKDDNKNLKGDVLVKALEKENWDPSVKSLVPFPQVIAMLNDKLEWTQQLGYAVANQQAAVLDSIQRLRRQAQKAGSLKTTEQQRVVEKEETVVIEPAQPETVYVPVYQPANVYGDWPYADNPPVYIPPPEAYYPDAYAPGYVWGAGLAFAAGAAVVAGLWGWARPRWGYGSVSINAARYNSINVDRGQINSGIWRPPAGGVVGRPVRPPGGPVGIPARPTQLPANAIGRGNIEVPGSAVNRPQIPARVSGAGVVQRPSVVQRPAAAPAPSVLRGAAPSVAQRPAAAGAFGGVGDGARASQFGARGAQSRSFQQGAAARGGGFQPRGGGGAVRGGGGAARGGGRR
jgi:Protein of unknown function (DUF3300)